MEWQAKWLKAFSQTCPESMNAIWFFLAEFSNDSHEKMHEKVYKHPTKLALWLRRNEDPLLLTNSDTDTWKIRQLVRKSSKDKSMFLS